MELEKSKKKITTSMINTISFNNFIKHAQVPEDDPHVVQLEFYSKVVEFINIFVTLRILTPENNETLKEMIDNNTIFLEVHKYALS